MNIITNTITDEIINKPKPIDEEVVFDGGVMITETDSKGIITYANRKFIEMSGYSNAELIGLPHSISRHPDMPKGAFRGLWQRISSKHIWNGYVKNLRKDGKYYWVHVYVQPKLVDDKIVGYIAGRKIVIPQIVHEIEKQYKALHTDAHIDNKYFLCADIEFIENTLMIKS